MRISDWSSDMCSSDLGGKILIAVPAHQWMWSAHDVVNHDHRRYSKASLAMAIADAGLTHRGLRWFNSLLFPAAVAARAWGKQIGSASCRVRVCPYVSISVVAVTLLINLIII